MLPRSADVVIVGGGVIGASIAYHLSRQNIAAVLLEKEDIGSGSSGACEGMLLLQSKKPGIHLDLALHSVNRYAGLAEELGREIEYERKGGLVVIETEAEAVAMAQFVEKQRAHGVNLSMLDTQQTREHEPALSPSIFGATYSSLDGQVNPFLLTQAYLYAARQRGAKVFTHTEVAGIEQKGSRIKSVITDKGCIETPIIVNAAGAYAGIIAEMVGLRVPIQPRRGQVIVSAAMPPFLNRCLLSAKYIAIKFNPEIAKQGGVSFAVEQTANGNVLMGSTREFAGFDRRTTREGIQAIAGKIVSVIPGLKQMQIIRTFAGLRPYTPDGLPILGDVDGLEGFIMAAGHEGDGITLSPVTGEMIAAHITAGKTPFAMAHFRLERFDSES